MIPAIIKPDRNKLSRSGSWSQLFLAGSWRSRVWFKDTKELLCQTWSRNLSRLCIFLGHQRTSLSDLNLRQALEETTHVSRTPKTSLSDLILPLSLVIGASQLKGLDVVLGHQRYFFSDFVLVRYGCRIRAGSPISAPTAYLGRAGLTFVLFWVSDLGVSGS